MRLWISWKLDDGAVNRSGSTNYKPMKANNDDSNNGSAESGFKWPLVEVEKRDAETNELMQVGLADLSTVGAFLWIDADDTTEIER